MKSKKKIIAAICGVLCMSTVLAFASCTNQEVETDQAPVIGITSKTELEGKTFVVGKPMNIPAATAVDLEDGDLGNKIKLKVFFARAGENVLIDGEEEVKGNSIVVFTPTKCGNYKAIYSVRDTGGNITKEEIPFTVVASGEEKAHQLISADKQEDWVIDGNGSAFNSEGAISLSKQNDASISYKGHKLKNGDIVQFRFNATQTNTRYFSIGGFMSRSYAEDAPVKDENQFANSYFYVCISEGLCEFWFARGVKGGTNDPLLRQSYNMVDGKDHTIGMRATLSEGGGTDGNILFEVWIDTEITEKASFSHTITAGELKETLYAPAANTAYETQFGAVEGETITKGALKTLVGDKFEEFYADMFEEGAEDDAEISLADLEAKFKQKHIDNAFIADFGDMFDEEKFGGFFNIGASHGEGTFELKALGINGEQAVGAPTLSVEYDATAEKHVMGEQITFPQVKIAEDGNDYSDLTNRVKLTVVKRARGDEPETRTVLDGFTFTPETYGKYQLIYQVTDYSGNNSFAYFDFGVLKTADALPPEIVISSEEEIKVQVGESVTLPTVTSALDPDGNDFAPEVKVELVGPEAQTLTGTEHAFFTAGEHIIRYSVEDFGGTLVTKDVKVVVESSYTGMLDLDDFNSAVEKQRDEQGNVTALQIAPDGSAGYNKQKIYGEKVSILMDATFATGWGAGNGINMIQIGLRTEKYADQNTNVNGTFGKFDWLNGIYMELNATDGIAVYGGKREGGQIMKVTSVNGKSVREAFSGGDHVFSYRLTDQWNEAHTRLTGIKIEMWLDGEVIRLNPQAETEEEKDYYVISSRRIQPYMSKSGWLSFYVNGDKKEGETYGPVLVKAVTIDGTAPQVLAVTVPSDVVKAAEAGAEYTLPAITATLGGEAIENENIDVYVLPYGSDDLGEKRTIGAAFTIDETLSAGFTVLYFYQNKEIARYTVTVNTDIQGLVYSQDVSDLRAEFGKEFTVPQVTAYKVGMTDGDDFANFNVKVLYDAGASVPRKEIPVEGTSFTPIEHKSFTLCYYYGDQKVSEIAVFVPDGGNIDSLLDGIQNGSYVYKYNDQDTAVTDGKVTLDGNNRNAFLYKNEHFYDEKITVNLDAHLARWTGATGAHGGAEVIQFNLRGKLTSKYEESPQYWPYIDWNASKTGLYLTVSTNIVNKVCGIQLVYCEPGKDAWNFPMDHFLSWWDCENGTEGAYTNYQGYWEDEYLPAGSDLSWQCTDVFNDDGVAVGVRVRVWIKTPTDTEEKLVIDKVVYENGGQYKGLFESYYFIAEASSRNKGDETHEKQTVINSVKIERTAPARVVEYEAKFNDASLVESVNPIWLYAENDFTVPAVTLKHNGELLQDDEYDVYLVDVNGKEEKLTERTFKLNMQKYGKGFTVVYKHGEKELLRTKRAYFVFFSGTEGTFKGDAHGTVGQSFRVKDMSFVLGLNENSVWTENGACKEGLGVYLVAKGTTTRVKYTDGGITLTEEFANGFTVIYNYLDVIDLARYDVDVYSASTEAAATASQKRDTVFTAPEVTALINGEAATEGTVAISIVTDEETIDYPEGGLQVAEKYWEKGFKVVYRYNDAVIYTIAVTVPEPVVRVDNADDLAENDLAALGDVYTLARLEATDTGDPVSRDRIKAYVVTGEVPADFTDLTPAGETVTVTGALEDGFKVVYTVDGKAVYTLEVTVAAYTLTFAEGTEFTATKGYDYTVPAFTVKLDTRDIDVSAAEVRILYREGDTDKTEITGKNGVIDVKDTWGDTATIQVFYHGIKLAEQTLTLAADEVESHVLAWKDGAEPVKTAAVNAAYRVAQPSRIRAEGTRVDIDDEHNVTVELLYMGGGAKRKTIAIEGDTYTPVENKSFTLTYYYNGIELETVVVTMENVGDIDDLVSTLKAGDYNYSINDQQHQSLTGADIELKNNLGNSFHYTAQELYDEKVTLTIDAHLASQWQSAEGGASVIFFKLRGQRTGGKTPFQYWPFLGRGDDAADCGLYFELKTREGFILEYGKRDSNILARYNPATGKNESAALPNWENTYLPEGSQISWQCTDVFNDNGVATGVRVRVWLKAPGATKSTTIFDQVVDATGKPDLFQSYNLLVETYTGFAAAPKEDDRGPSKIRNIKIERNPAEEVLDTTDLLNGLTADDYVVSGSTRYVSNAITLPTSAGVSAFAYKTKQFYDEKITVTLDARMAPKYFGDGASVIAFKLRGDTHSGDSLSVTPSIIANSKTNLGLWLRLRAESGIQLVYGDNDTGVIATYSFGTADWQKEFFPAGSQLSWQCTDIFAEDGTTKTGVRVQVWIKVPGGEEQRVIDHTVNAAEGKEDLFDNYYFVTQSWGTGDATRGPSFIWAVHSEANSTNTDQTDDNQTDTNQD